MRSPNPLIPEDFPIELDPLYVTSTANQPVVLFDGKFSLLKSEGKYEGNGSVRLNWLPQPLIVFDIQLENPSLSDIQRLGDDASIEIPGFDNQIKVVVTSQNFSAGVNGISHNLKGFVDACEFGEPSNLQAIVFHIPNFIRFAGMPVRDKEQTHARSAQAVVEVDCWRLTIERVATADEDLYEELRNTGGFALTHVGKIERLNNGLFSAEPAMEILHSIMARYLSFCRGIRISPLLAVGYDENNNKVWNEWSTRQVQRWRNGESWFNDMSADRLTQGFPGFYHCLKDDVWREPLSQALNWYIECNNQGGGQEGAIILAQAGFELLSWTLLVDKKAVLSKKRFGKLPAMEKLRLLLIDCGIPAAIPATLSDLQMAAEKFNWVDGPQALTAIRNASVHSDLDKRKRFFNERPLVKYDAWSLCNWYLEMIMLKISNMKGNYSNRLVRPRFKGGEIKPVPWSSKTDGVPPT